MDKANSENMASTTLNKLQCNLGVLEAAGRIVIWMVLSFITLGVALLFFPYFLNKYILNKTFIVGSDGQIVGNLDCQFNIANSTWHLILWGILIVCTCGLASFFFVYYVIKVIVNETYIEYY